MKTFFKSFGVIILSVALMGCGTAINQKNYDRISKDMTEEQVTAILGKPTESSSTMLLGISARSATWKSKDGTISIQFMNGKVISKNFTQEEVKKD